MAGIWTSSVPFTYEIGYASNKVGNREFYRDVAAGRPRLVHVGHDVPLNSATGNTIQFTPSAMRYIEPDQIPARIEELRAYVHALHEAGATTVIPYLITMLLIGSPMKRTGFWQLYDRWEEFASLGLGPKPETEPLEWLQSGPRPFPRLPDMFAYETTICHPAIRRFMDTCVDLVAQCGYDGTFLDVNTIVGWHEEDRKAFCGYLRTRYTEAELAELFCFPSYDEALLGHPGDGLLWFETQRFRSWAFGQMFVRLREIGRARMPSFFLLPNNSPLCTIAGFFARRDCGHEIGQWHAGCEIVMFEEMQQPGRFGMDRINDDIMQYRYALAHGMKGVLLLYNAKDADGIALANAEAAAGGGGAFVQAGYAEAAAMRFWGDWFDAHRPQLDGLVSLHDVGMVFFAEEMYWGNRKHVEAAFKLRQALCDSHILFDLVVEPHFTAEALRSFSVVIVPEVQCLSEAQVALLADYAAGGGGIVFVGPSGSMDERGRPRKTPLRERFAAYGDRVVWIGAYTDLVPSWGPDLFDFTEDEFNDLSFVLALPDRASSFHRAQEKRRAPLVALLEQLAGRRLRVLDDDAPFTLRASAFCDPASGRTIVHLVNYNLPVRGVGKSGRPIPARDIRIDISAVRARWWTPDGVEGEPLAIRDGAAVVPSMRIYAMVEIEPNA